jgi:hypothetical protein
LTRIQVEAGVHETVRKAGGYYAFGFVFASQVIHMSAPADWHDCNQCPDINKVIVVSTSLW